MTYKLNNTRNYYMSENSYIVKFEGENVADANQCADELKTFLLEKSSDYDVEIKVDLHREDPTTQDFGGSLILILGTPAVLAVAKGISAWLSKRNTSSVTITTKDGKIVAKNISAKGAESIIIEKLGSQ